MLFRAVVLGALRMVCCARRLAEGHLLWVVGMDFRHDAVTSPIFELIETFEFDMSLGDNSWPTRVELYRARKNEKLFRCRVWQAEHYRIQSVFPQRNGSPEHEPSDEMILVEYSSYLRCNWNPEGFEADSPEGARQLVENALLAFLDHSTGRPTLQPERR